MATRNAKRICAYCGQLKKITVDHVPPKVLLPKPYPRNLRTVPACDDCNRSFQKDDEYTASVLGVDVRAMRNAAAQARLPTLIRSLQRPKASAFASYLESQKTRSWVLGPDGLPLGAMIDADRARVNATGAHIVRGLYYFEAGKPVSPTAAVNVASHPGVPDAQPVITQFAKTYAGSPERRDGEVGSGFSYVAASGPGYSVWLLLLYEYFFWVATITEPFIESVEPGSATA